MSNAASRDAPPGSYVVNHAAGTLESGKPGDNVGVERPLERIERPPERDGDRLGRSRSRSQGEEATADAFSSVLGRDEVEEHMAPVTIGFREAGKRRQLSRQDRVPDPGKVGGVPLAALMLGKTFRQPWCNAAGLGNDLEREMVRELVPQEAGPCVERLERYQDTARSGATRLDERPRAVGGVEQVAIAADENHR